MTFCRCSISRFILKGIVFQYTQLQRMDLDTDDWESLRYPLNLLKFSWCSWRCRVEACIFMHIFPIVSCNQMYNVYSPMQEQINTCYSFCALCLLLYKYCPLPWAAPYCETEMADTLPAVLVNEFSFFSQIIASLAALVYFQQKDKRVLSQACVVFFIPDTLLASLFVSSVRLGN